MRPLFLLASIFASRFDIAICKSPCNFKIEIKRYGEELVNILRERHTVEEAQLAVARRKYEFNNSWAANDLCRVAGNLIKIVKGVFPENNSRQHIVLKHLPRLLLKYNESSKNNLGQIIFHTFTDILDYPEFHPSHHADVCPAEVLKAKGTLLWWISDRDSKAPLLIKVALAALDAESSGWTLAVVYSDNAAPIVRAIEDALPSRCRKNGLAIRTIKLSVLGVPQPPSRGDLSCFQFSQAYYDLSSTEHILVAGGDDVVVRRPLLEREYSYALLGAPWIWCRTAGYPEWCKYGGNGGFSYRAKSFTKKYGIRADPKKSIIEWKAACAELRHLDDSLWARSIVDEIYAKQKSLWKWAGPEIQAQFSTETVRTAFKNPCGLHKTWKYSSYGMDSAYISSLLVAPARALGSFSSFVEQ